MARPDERPLRRLPQLETRRQDLERCVFCPKLCRSACPVSNVDTRETVTPWGKMSMAYFVANESVELAESFAQPAWACTGCFGCREHCDHENDVTGTLFEARSAMVSAGTAPASVKRVLEGYDPVVPRADAPSDDNAKTAVLIGCEHARQKTAAGVDTIVATAKLTQAKVCQATVCCGAPLLYAGDQSRFQEQARRFAESVRGKDQLIVGDAGCAATIRVHFAEKLRMPVLHFSELAAREVTRLKRLDLEGAVRWHDPCQLGRGLGVYDAPRQILSRVLGRAPDEFARAREDARCSGAGGLLPVTMPGVARGIAEQRLADHDRSGGGTIVTACASSARAFARAAGGEGQVLDLATVVARALES
ncbi:MAG: (Fe-S)-binding protein [Labilithrix sp.]